MSIDTYLPMQTALQAGALIAIVLAALYLVLALAGWRGPHQEKRLVRFAFCLLAAPVFLLIHVVLLNGLVFPYEARQQQLLQQERANEASFVHVGDPAPSFSVVDTTGAEIDLQELRGTVVLVNFFATWCGPCLEELPHLQKLWEEFSENDNFEMIVIGREETHESVIEFQSTHGYTFPMAPDPERTSYSLFAKELIPRTYLVSKDGTICFATAGFYEEDAIRLESELAKQLRLTR